MVPASLVVSVTASQENGPGSRPSTGNVFFFSINFSFMLITGATFKSTWLKTKMNNRDECLWNLLSVSEVFLECRVGTGHEMFDCLHIYRN